MKRQLVLTHVCCFFRYFVGVRESGPPIFSPFRLCRSSYLACDGLFDFKITTEEKQNFPLSLKKKKTVPSVLSVGHSR